MKKLFFIFMLLFIIFCWFLPSSALDIHKTETDTIPAPFYDAVKTYHQTRIVGGNPVTDPSKYPWMAALVDSDTDNIYYGQFCGAALINSEWLVTAAHCVCESPDYVMSPDELNVVLGTVDLNADPDTYERLEVSKIIINPNYNPVITDNDIALIKLKTPSAQSPIEFIATEEIDPSLSNTPVMTTAIGWGDTRIQRSSYPNQLQEVDLPLVFNDECASILQDDVITDNMLCAGYLEGGKDSCFGDSGGPLVIDYPKGGYNLIGIVSWGHGCAQPNSYGVYTRVSKMREWIFRHLEVSYIVLTDSSNQIIYSGSNVNVYGHTGINNITIQSGANAKLINFPGVSTITIQSSYPLFKISRSGATVTLKNEADNTKVSIPATKNTQYIIFDAPNSNNDLTKTLKILKGKAMFGSQEVTKTEEFISETIGL